LGLLFDIQFRELTKGKKSLDDLMRLLYNRYFLKENRGFTEEEFWASAEEIAGVPLPTLREYVDTTNEIDYDKMLAPAGLRLNKSSWKLEILPNLNPLQEKIHTDMFGR
jgi:predicted metalloprotease with PDZ domain